MGDGIRDALRAYMSYAGGAGEARGASGYKNARRLGDPETSSG